MLLLSVAEETRESTVWLHAGLINHEEKNVEEQCRVKTQLVVFKMLFINPLLLDD